MENLSTPKQGYIRTNSTKNLSFNSIDLVSLGYEIVNYWATKPEIQLNWINIEQFSDKIEFLKKLKDSKTFVGKRRQKIMDELFLLDREINMNLIHVLVEIERVYKKDAVRFYPFFGIICRNRNYCFPMEQNNRLESLNLLVYAMRKHNFDKTPFGISYWEHIQKQYHELLRNRYSPNFKLPIRTMALMPLKRDIYKVFNSLIYSIKANYPYTYKEEIEKWGFTKSKY